MLLADFTGNGRLDILGRTSGGGWWMGQNTGSNFTNVYFGQWSEAAGWHDVMVGDFAGDSRPDVIGRTTGGQWWVATSTIGGFSNQYYGSWSPDAGWQNVMTGNFSGGAKDDVVGMTSGGQWWVARNDQPSFSNQLFGQWALLGWYDADAGVYFDTPTSSEVAAGEPSPPPSPEVLATQSELAVGAALSGDDASGGSFAAAAVSDSGAQTDLALLSQPPAAPPVSAATEPPSQTPKSQVVDAVFADDDTWHSPSEGKGDDGEYPGWGPAKV